MPAMKDNPNAKRVEDAEKRSDETSMETFRRIEAMKPTPTQHELNLANVGALDLTQPKEDDGGGPELVQVRTVVPSTDIDEQGQYKTRSMSGSQSPPPRSEPRQPKPAA